ncbi:unnamed protein product [Ectocarpus sp. 4 AP-2014]|uniref:EsV-1-77 n=1 Tax=Ectocarpus siliculosus virus 1 (isolate New Zealand/Kaikoura/1988) TaxID=654926 RepID=Q8QNJ6_ESV1K|nr:EsV-1-77 [Ectocarpus siliculosus virus 1]AAK14500.1 EsV-1-77 [Ectocarpus siliculosus virus 1]
MSDRQVLDDIVGVGSGSPVSGPWRLTVWDAATTGKLYVFSEEHANKGSCPQNRHFSSLASEILQKTSGVHVLVENFIHAYDITTPKTGIKTSVAQACSAVNVGILNNLRSCLEVMKINSQHCPGGCAKRIHFIDPRVDMVSVLPDGKLFEAISFYAHHKASHGSFDDAVLTVFESLVHPLSSLLPDRANLAGRLVGVFETFRNKMTPVQRVTFDRIWVRDITGGIADINAKYVKLHENYCASRRKRAPSLANFSQDVEEIKQLYKRYTNKFMDVWLLAHIFMIQNTAGSNGMVMYLGSLHGLEIEKYLSLHGLRKIHHSENQHLDSCLLMNSS